MAPLTVSILYNKANPQEDVDRIEQLLKHVSIGQTIQKPKRLDPREPLIHCDIQLHLDAPVYAAIPWAHTNLLLVNPDQWTTAYHAYVHAFDALLFRDTESKQKVEDELTAASIATNHLYVIPWSRPSDMADAMTPLFKELQLLVLTRRPRGVVHCPPLLQIQDCPSISIITPTYNRKKLIEIAFHNLLATDYPQDKIEWIVIEDNEKTPHMVTEKIMNFQIQVPAMKIKYIPIEGRMTIGEKRNLAIEQASYDIILFMDDDDHYPSTSFRRRVAWLTKGVKRGRTEHTISCCTTLALYDLQRGVSAVNVPPMDLPLSQRISEATLTFYKVAWEERKFPSISVAEGEGWIQGRENQVIEIPPQQIIVAFTHGANQTSRRVPPDQPPSCFWGFPKEYLMFIHGLVGVQVEEDKKKR